MDHFSKATLATKKSHSDDGYQWNWAEISVMGKIFALTDVEKFDFINLKCDPEWAIELREGNPGITPGYHMNKQQWNSVQTDGAVSDPLLTELINHSYDLIAASLPKKLREDLEDL